MPLLDCYVDCTARLYLLLLIGMQQQLVACDIHTTYTDVCMIRVYQSGEASVIDVKYRV